MPPNAKLFYDENEDKLEYDPDDVPIEPSVLIPPAISTLSINDISVQNDPLKNISWTTRFSGIMYSLTASFVFTCAVFTIKYLGIDLLDAFFLRFIVYILSSLIYAYRRNYQLLSGNGFQIFLQTLCCGTGAGCFLSYFFAVRYVELSDVTTLSYTRVVWTLVFSTIVYRERPSKVSLIALPLTLLGVVFIAQPSFFFGSKLSSNDIVINNNFRLLGLSLAIGSAIGSAINVLTFKRLISTSKDVKPSIINLHYSLSIFILLIFYQFYKKYFLHNGLTLDYIKSWRFILASVLGTLVIIPNILSQKAIKRENPAVYTLLSSTDIIFALILQNMFKTKKSDLCALLGTTLIILSVVILGVSKIMTERRIHKQAELIMVRSISNHDEEKQTIL